MCVKWILMPVCAFVSMSKGVTRCMALTKRNLPLHVRSDKASKQLQTSNNGSSSSSSSSSSLSVLDHTCVRPGGY